MTRTWKDSFPRKKTKQPKRRWPVRTYTVESVEKERHVGFLLSTAITYIDFCVRVVFESAGYSRVGDDPLLKDIAFKWASYKFYEELKAALAKGEDKSIGVRINRYVAYVYVH